MSKKDLTKNSDVDLWLGLSHALFKQLLPKGSGYEMCGKGMDPDEFAALVDSEMDRVDHALVAMAEARDENEIEIIIGQLARDTLIGLFSRWVHYQGEWKKLLYDPNPPLWIPPLGKDIWRAILLTMTSEELRTSAVKRLWPELF